VSRQQERVWRRGNFTTRFTTHFTAHFIAHFTTTDLDLLAEGVEPEERVWQERLHECVRRRIHACHVRRRIHAKR